MKARLLKIIEEEIITYELLYEGVFKTFYSEDELNKYVIKNNIEIISREDIFSEDTLKYGKEYDKGFNLF